MAKTPRTPGPPEPLAAAHRLDAFDSGVPVLAGPALSEVEGLRRRALANEVGGASRTYVICDDTDVIGYYALAAGALAHDSAPGNIRRNMPDPIPVMVLGRLAIDRRHQGKGLGRALLRDALLRTLQAARIGGIRAMLVHAISDEARTFYVRAGFIESPLDPMTLMVSLAQAERLLEG